MTAPTAFVAGSSTNPHENPPTGAFRRRIPDRLPIAPGERGTAAGTHLWAVTEPDHDAPPIILTQDEAGALLQIPPRTLEDWRLTGYGPPWRKIGRHVRYERADVIAWFRSQPDHA